MNLGTNSDSKRIAIVTRRFWPICSSTELAACEVANELDAAGHQVDIFTIRWEKNWPGFFKYQNLNVHRINRPVSGPWGGFRYVRNLNRAIVEQDPEAIIVFGVGDEAWSVSKTFAGKVPFTIRIDSLVLGAKATKPSFSTRQLTALDAAERLVVDSQWTADRLAMHSGIDAQKISVIADPIPTDLVSADPGEAKQPSVKSAAVTSASARIAISDAHPVLMIEADQPLVVTAAPMEDDMGMLDLVAAWPRVLRRYPNARLWIIGEGKNSRRVWDLIMEKHLVHSVIMPGSFDVLEDVFSAADLYVHPLRSNQSCSFLKLAIAQGLCPIVTEHPFTTSVVENRTSGIVVGPQDGLSLSNAILESLSDEEFRNSIRENAGRFPDSSCDSRLAEELLSSFSSTLD